MLASVITIKELMEGVVLYSDGKDILNLRYILKKNKEVLGNP